MARTALGPKRHPTRNGDPVSNGMPTTATSTPSRTFVWGSRMNVVIPQKRGLVRESWGRNVGIRASLDAAGGGALDEELEERLGGQADGRLGRVVVHEAQAPGAGSVSRPSTSTRWRNSAVRGWVGAR